MLSIEKCLTKLPFPRATPLGVRLLILFLANRSAPNLTSNFTVSIWPFAEKTFNINKKQLIFVIKFICEIKRVVFIDTIYSEISKVDKIPAAKCSGAILFSSLVFTFAPPFSISNFAISGRSRNHGNL